MKKSLIYMSAGGVLFIVSMVRNRDLPIVKRIKISGKQSLGATGMALTLILGNFNGKNVGDDVFKGNKTPIVLTTSSIRDCTQSLTSQKSEWSSSYSIDELEALGFETVEKTRETEVRLVVGVPMPHLPHSSNRLMSFQQENSAQPSNIPLNVEQEPKVLLIRKKSDLTNAEWIQKFISSFHGGAQEVDEKLIQSIISKLADSSLSTESVNKFLMRLANAACSVLSNQDLLRILAELEKPIPQSSIFVEGWVNPLPRHRKRYEVEKPKYSSPSIEFLLDSTKCYGHREAYNMPREVSERFESNAVSKLAKNSLKNPTMKKEYTRIKKSLNDGIHSVNIGKKSTFIGGDTVLIKAAKGRYLAKVSDTHVDILGFVSRSSDVKSFENLMNTMYNLDLKGY